MTIIECHHPVDSAMNSLQSESINRKRIPK